MVEPTIVSVDLDGIDCYHRIHGLAPPPPEQRHVVLRRCLPRFLDAFASLGIRATFFVIGRDLERDLDDGGEGARWLEQALADGHELANHSYAHAYDLSVWGSGAIRSDLERCDALLRDLGADVFGFRAPGYTHDRRLLEQVRAVGYRYDSSALPSPPYYLAKITAIGLQRLGGRRSESMIRGARSFLGARRPHLVPGLDLWELPVSVSPRLRLPMVGTFVLGGPSWLRRVAAAMPELHLELHGIDLADPVTDGFAPALASVQPELRSTLSTRRERLLALLRERGSTSRCRDLVA